VPNGTAVMKLLSTLKAEARPLQSRGSAVPGAIPKDEDLERAITAMEPEEATVTYLTISTGCRAACVHNLWTDQLDFGRDSVNVNWWSRKATNTKTGFCQLPSQVVVSTPKECT